MVSQNPRFSRTRTGAQGGLRRGSASATLGAVLVFSAIIPATPAAAAATDTLSVGVDSDAGSLLSGLLGAAVPDKPKPSATSSPTPSPSSAPAETSAATPTGTASPSPQPAAATDAPVTSAALAPVPAAGNLAPTSEPTVPPAPAAGTGTAGQAQPPASDAPKADAQPPKAVERSGAAAIAGTPENQAQLESAGMSSAAEAMAGRVPEARQAANQAPVPVVVWWGVGLVGFGVSAAGIFFRLRRA